MAKDPIQSLYDWSNDGYDTQVTEASSAVTTPDGLGETFSRGYRQGLEGIATDLDYFKGLFNTAIGDEEAAAKNIEEARQRETRNIGAFGELQNFEEFVENPTFGGFLTQVAKNVGQVTPYLFTTVGSGLGGAAVTGLAKFGAGQASKHVTRRLVTDAFEKKMKGELTDEVEDRILNVSYRLAQRNNPLGNVKLSTGAKAGMYGQEYTTMAGSNFGENLDFLDDDEAALRAAGLAIPQAFIGLKGEELLGRMLVKDLGELAAKRTTKEGSAFSEYAKRLGTFSLKTGRGATTEMVAETLQEGISVANRFSIDDQYTKEEALLRLGESAFAGFFGGGAITGAGNTAVGAFRGAGGVLSKAKNYIEEARQQKADKQIDEEQYGTDSMGFTAPEPQAAVNAQVRAAVDPSSSRHSVWIEGDQPQYNAKADTTTEVEVESGVDEKGKVTYEKLYVRFIPGRGTILSKNFDIAEQVALSEASESSLAEALGYSAPKPVDADIAIEALDPEGNVVWQQGVNEDGVADAMAAAEKQVPEGGSVRRISIKQALEDRKKAYEQERGPTVRNIDVPEDVREAFAGVTNDNNFINLSDLDPRQDPIEVDENERLTEDEGVQDVAAFAGDGVQVGGVVTRDVTGDKPYKPTGGKVFEDTEAARAEFQEAYKDEDLPELGKDEYDTEIDFSDPRFGNMSSAFLRFAAKMRRENPGAFLPVINEDGTYSLYQTVDPQEQIYSDSRDPESFKDPDIDDGQVKRKGVANTVREFVRRALKTAAASEFARKTYGGKKTRKNPKGWRDKKPEELVTVDGKPVNLVDLVAEGMRMLSNENNTMFTEGGQYQRHRAGFVRMMAELIGGNPAMEVRIGGILVTDSYLNQIQAMMAETEGQIDLMEAYSKEMEALAEAEGVDAPNVSIPELEQMYNELALLEEEAKSEPTIANLIIESKAYARAYKEFMESPEKQAHMKAVEEYKAAKEADPDADIEYPEGPEAPKKTGLLALMDVTIGFEEGRSKNQRPKAITLGKALRTQDRLARDRKYEVVNVAGDVVFEGNRDQTIEYMDNNPDATLKIYRPDRTTRDGTVLPPEEVTYDALVNDEPQLGFEGELGFVPDMEVDTDNFDTESKNAFGYANPGSEVATKNVGVETVGLDGTGLNLVRSIFKTAARRLGLSKPVTMFNVDTLLEGGEDITNMFGDPEVLKYVTDVARELKDNPQGGGRYIGFGDAHIILLDPSVATNSLDAALIGAHELGHALFREQLNSTLKNPALYNRLFADFQKARDKKGAPESYKGKRGFEEWYADQVAIWASKEYMNKQAKGLVEAVFKQLGRKLMDFYKALSRDLKKRFGNKAYSPDFDGYMKEVLKRRYAADVELSAAKVATMEKKIIVRKMAEVIEKERPGFVGAIQRKVDAIIRSDGFTPIYNFMFTADSRLRKIAGNNMADLFYSRAQDSKGRGRNKLGFIKKSMLEGNKWFNELEKMLDGKLDSEEVQASIDIAFSDTPTRDITDANALKVREWFDRFYDEYIEPSNTDVGRRRDYAPVVLKLSAVEENPQALIKAILEAEPEADEAKVKRAVSKLVGYQQAVMDEAPINIERTDPSASAEEAIRLTRLVGRDKLKELNLLEDSDVALMKYTANMVKRVEWNRNTKDDFGNSIYEEELKKLSPKAQEEVQKIVHKYLGYQETPLSPMWRAINSWGSVLQIFAILPLAVLGSIPELAGPVIASKEFSAVTVAMKEIVKTVQNRDEARLLARDLGIVTSQSVANVMMSQAELDFMDTQARKITDGFFRVTLLDTYTKFTREFAANMGVRFLEKHADPETANAFSARYLRELGVTAEDVKAWSDSNQDFSTPEGKKVREALQRFVESSTLRPNAAERPLWASDPRWALIWQLKGFFYSYGKVLLAGAKREAGSRLEGASRGDVTTAAALTGAAGVFALMGIATMPLAMVGMELREYVKYGLAWAIPGVDHNAKNYFRTDDMGWMEYLGAAFDRSFAAGPVTIGSQAMQAMDWGRGITGAAAVVAGPTAETINRMFTDGFSSTFENRMLPTGLL